MIIDKEQIIEEVEITYNGEKITDTDIKPSVEQCLDILIMEFVRQGCPEDGKISIPLQKYMDIRGLKDRKETKKQLKKCLTTLLNISIDCTNEIAKTCIINYFIIKKDIDLSFAEPYARYLKNSKTMAYSKNLATINTKKHPHSISLGTKILDNKNMNIGKSNENIISVKALLQCTSIPTYEDVKEKQQSKYKEKIIQPFERDMNALYPTLTWSYCSKKGEPPLTDEELQKLNYNTFINLNVKYKLNAHKKKKTSEQA